MIDALVEFGEEREKVTPQARFEDDPIRLFDARRYCHGRMPALE